MKESPLPPLRKHEPDALERRMGALAAALQGFKDAIESGPHDPTEEMMIFESFYEDVEKIFVGAEPEILGNRLLDLLNRLLSWAEEMGGWTAPVWAEVEQLRDAVATALQEASEVACKKCGSRLKEGLCCDATCPYSDRKQDEGYTEG